MKPGKRSTEDSRPAGMPDACPGSLRRPRSSSRRAVIVVEPAEHGERRNWAGDPGPDAFTRNRNALADPLMGPSRVEVAQRVFGQDVVQVPLGER